MYPGTHLYKYISIPKDAKDSKEADLLKKDIKSKKELDKITQKE